VRHHDHECVAGEVGLGTRPHELLLLGLLHRLRVGAGEDVDRRTPGDLLQQRAGRAEVEPHPVGGWAASKSAAISRKAWVRLAAAETVRSAAAACAAAERQDERRQRGAKRPGQAHRRSPIRGVMHGRL
jgi:hypothetical protein